MALLQAADIALSPQVVALSRRYLRLLGLAAMVWWFGSSVNGLLPQLQMMLLGGQVFIPNSIFKALLLLLLAGAVAVRGIRLSPRGITYAWQLFLAYLLFELFYFLSTTSLDAGYLLASFILYYMLLFVAPFRGTLCGLVCEDRMVLWILLLFVPLALLGVAQYFTTDPIVSTRSVDGYFTVIAWNYWATGNVRAFSLFSSSAQLGHYCTLVAALLIAWGLRRDSVPYRPLIAALFVLAQVTIYATLARTIYLESLSAIVFAWMIMRARDAGRVVFLPLLAWFIGYMVAVGGPDLVHWLGLGDSQLLSGESLDYRRMAWRQYGDLWLGQGWSAALLGTGLIQSGEFGSADYVLIDNAFIAAGLHIGLVGLLLWLALMWQIWREMLRAALAERSVFAVGLTSVWATWPLACMFNSTTIFYLVLYILFLCRSVPASVPRPAVVPAA